jgi:hypothetical protein
MLCDGRPIGVEISFGYKRRLFAHVLAIGDAFAQGYQVYDLLAPENPYKAVWTGRGVEVLDFALIANPRGALSHAVGAGAVELGGALAERVPRAVVRTLLRRIGRSGDKAGPSAVGAPLQTQSPTAFGAKRLIQPSSRRWR